MIVNEILLPEWVKMVLILVLAVIAYKAWKWENPQDIQAPKREPEHAPRAVNELDQLNPDYGRYVWLAGKRFN